MMGFIHLTLFILTAFGDANSYRKNYSIPVFNVQPPRKVIFANSTGTSIPCAAVGSPTPTKSWVSSDGKPLTEIPGIRYIREDSSLLFLPFPSAAYRSDVHSAIYRCVATNSMGSVSSNEVFVKAVVLQPFEIQLTDALAIRGNMAVIHCPVPPQMSTHVKVLRWERADGLIISQGTMNGKSQMEKYGMLTNGDLYIVYATELGNTDTFRCQVQNTVTKEEKWSINYARVKISAPVGNMAPRIVWYSNNTTAFPEQRVMLSCVARAYPAPTYRWFRLVNNKFVPIFTSRWIRQESGILIFLKVNTSDGGVYQCLVTNVLGEDTVEIPLTVTDGLKVSAWPSHVEVFSGQTIEINCSASATNTAVKFRWMKDAILIPSYPAGPTVITHSSRSVLRLENLKTKDAGIYQCFGDNSEDSDTAIATVVVRNVRPRLLRTFSDKTIHPGRSVHFSCISEGLPLPQVNWTLDGIWSLTDIQNVIIHNYSTRDDVIVSYLNITSTNVSNSGVYTCEAFNSEGSVSSSARLNVFGRISARPSKNKTTVEGRDFFAHCPFSGYPFESITWEKDGRPLPLNFRQEVFKNGSLLISDVQGGEDEGSYHCIVSYGMQRLITGPFSLSVRISPRISPFNFEDNLKEGMRTAAACIISAGDKPFSIRWLKDGLPINDALPDVSILYTDGGFVSTLTIDNLMNRHNGNYTCLASNYVATESHTASLRVKVAPRWVIKPEDTSSVSGDTVTMDCQADGVPQPHIRWKVNTGPGAGQFKIITSSSHVHILANGSLVIKNVLPSDAGSYLCEADNGVGSRISALVKLTVHTAPQVDTISLTKETRRGQRTSLECVAKGETPIMLFWKRNGIILNTESELRYAEVRQEKLNETISRLIIDKSEAKDTAVFSCVANNDYGEDSRNIQVTVQDIPDAPQNLDAYEITSRNLRLTWSHPFDGNSPITSYIVSWRISDASVNEGQLVLPATEESVAIDNLKPGTKYFFRVKCGNKFGESQFSAEASATTLQEAPKIAPTNVIAVPVSSSSISVSWKYFLDDSSLGNNIEGFHIGYKARNSDEPYTFITKRLGDSTRHFEANVFGLSRLTEYSVIVQAFNSRGAGPSTEETFVRTLEFDAPKTPLIKTYHTTSSTVNISWEVETLLESPVSGYELHHRFAENPWQEKHFIGNRSSYVMKGLHCGSTHKFYLIATNSAGKSEASNIVTAKTKGNPPIAPGKQLRMSANSSSTTIDLTKWRDGGCPILSFLVKYKRTDGESDWLVISEKILPERRLIRITDLTPATWYLLFVSARNEAGSTDSEYKFATTTLTGELPPSPSEISDISSEKYVYRHWAIIVPLICFGVVVILALLSVFLIDFNPSDRQRQQERNTVCSKEEQFSLSVTHEGGRPGSVYMPSPYATTGLQREYDSGVEDNSGHHCTNYSLDSRGKSDSKDDCFIYDIPYPVQKSNKDEHNYQPIIFPRSDTNRNLEDCVEANESVYTISKKGSENACMKSRPNKNVWCTAVDSKERKFPSRSPYRFKQETQELEAECDSIWKAGRTGEHGRRDCFVSR